VRAVDASGNEEQNTNVVGQYTITLAKGYNAVSLPLIPFDANIAAVMHQDATYHPVDEIKRFNASLQSFQAAFYNPSFGWATPQTFSQLKFGEGYLLHATQNADFIFAGTPASQLVLDLKQGMNLVGLTVHDDKLIADLNTSIQEVFDRSSDRYGISTYYSNWSGDIISILHGKAYWAKVDQDMVISQ